MKILFISDNFYPETNAPAKRTLEHCIEWKNLGNDVTVITGAPNFPKGKVFAGYKNKVFQEEKINGINVKRVWTFISPNEGFFLRIVDYISFMLSSMLIGLLTKKHDVIIATSPQFFTLISGYFISLFKRTPLVIEIRDLWPESIATVGAIKKSNIFYKIILKLSNFLYKKAQVIICVTQSFKNDLINRNINKNKIFVIENGFNFNNSLLPKKTIYEIEKKYNINHNKFNVAFTGTVGLAHGLEIIINTAKLLRNINFYIIGEGAKKNELIKKAKELKINNIYFINNLSWQEIVDINQSIDMHLVHLIDSDEFKKVIPSKIFESMALKKPIILGVKGESEKIIDKARCGFKITPENEKEFAEVISNIINKKYLINDFGENGFNYLVRNNSRTILADKMIKSISKIISRN
jgi:glycosyltransferase involved in cell wall biosynthesis